MENNNLSLLLSITKSQDFLDKLKEYPELFNNPEIINRRNQA